jgi:hypothetical protein
MTQKVNVIERITSSIQFPKKEGMLHIDTEESMRWLRGRRQE